MDIAWKHFKAGQNKDNENIIKYDAFYRKLVGAFGFLDREMINSAYDKSIEKVADSNFNHVLYPPMMKNLRY